MISYLVDAVLLIVGVGRGNPQTGNAQDIREDVERKRAAENR